MYCGGIDCGLRLRVFRCGDLIFLLPIGFYCSVMMALRSVQIQYGTFPSRKEFLWPQRSGMLFCVLAKMGGLPLCLDMLSFVVLRT